MAPQVDPRDLEKENPNQITLLEMIEECEKEQEQLKKEDNA